MKLGNFGGFLVVFVSSSLSCHSELGIENIGGTKKRYVGDTTYCWTEKPTMQRAGVLRKDDISHHLVNIGTVSLND